MMTMNRKMLALILLLGVLSAATPVWAKFSSEYKLIKRAVEKGDAVARPGAGQWLKMEVVDKKKSGHVVKLSIPIALVDIVVKSAKGDQVNICGSAELDFRKAWDMLNKGGPAALLEVNCEDDYVKIWLE
jgi:hypothetical protein